MSVENNTNRIRDTFINLNLTNAGIGTTTGTATAGATRIISGISGGAAVSGTAGDGGSVTIQGGHAGTCSGAGIGGNGGNVILTPGNGGSTVGGTNGINGLIQINGVFIKNLTVSSVSTAGSATYTITQLKGGLIVRNPGGVDRNDNLPTALLSVAALPGISVGDALFFSILNDSNTNQITINAGTGGTMMGQANHSIISRNRTGEFIMYFTNVTTPAYLVYRLNTI